MPVPVPVPFFGGVIIALKVSNGVMPAAAAHVDKCAC